MTKVEKIDNITNIVNVDLETVDGRQEVVNACKLLYNEIEDDILKSDYKHYIDDIYDDLRQGDFSTSAGCMKKIENIKSITKWYFKKIYK